MDTEKDLRDILNQLSPDELQLALRLMRNMAHSSGFTGEYDRRTSANGGPLLPDILAAFMDEWESAHILEASA